MTESLTLTTRDRVRQAALDLFGERGYDGASMAELAERVGIAKPSLYNYYRSKEELMLDLVGEGMRLWETACIAPFRGPGSFERQLADHLRLTVEFAREHPHLVSVFHLASSHVQGDLAARVFERMAAMEAKIRTTIGERIEAALAAGELDAASAADVHIFLGIFFHGLLFLQTNCEHEVGPVEARLPEVWRFLFRALSGRDPKECLQP